MPNRGALSAGRTRLGGLMVVRFRLENVSTSTSSSAPWLLGLSMGKLSQMTYIVTVQSRRDHG